MSGKLLDQTGIKGLQPWSVRPNYQSYKSPYGPQYRITSHYHGLNFGRALTYAGLAAGMGGVAGVFALFFFADVPKVRHDILEKIPIIGDTFKHEVAPEDNPF